MPPELPSTPKPETGLTSHQKKLFSAIKDKSIPPLNPAKEGPPISAEQTAILEMWGIVPPRSSKLAYLMIDYIKSGEGVKGADGKDMELDRWRKEELQELQRRYPRGSVVMVRDGTTYDFAKVIDIEVRTLYRKDIIHQYVKTDAALAPFEMILLFRGSETEIHKRALKYIRPVPGIPQVSG